jgi:hypothetical protein
MMYVEDKRRVQATETRAFTRSQARKERMLWQQQNQQAAAGAPSQ